MTATLWLNSINGHFDDLHALSCLMMTVSGNGRRKNIIQIWSLLNIKRE